jgi:hypothetical protein
MTERYPDDDALNALSGLTDAGTGLPLPAIGESPYFTSFYRLADHINRMLAPVNQLRVYKDGDLSFGVRPGWLQSGDDAIEYAGAESQALTDDAVNSVYLTVSGTTVTLNVSTSGFPTPSVTPHWPLATIATGSHSVAATAGNYTHADITDHRTRAWASGPVT